MRPHLLSRRDFLASSALGLSAACARPEPARPGSPTDAETPQVPAFELDEATVETLQDGMRSGRYTARRIAELYLDRIERIDRQGPTLRSVIETNPDALAIAEELDRERAAGRIRGPLHGIPVLVKDNIATGDKMLTTAGSLALAGAPAPRDAFIARRLRDAGAVILGKANLSEWANFRSSRSSSGWSARGGQCRNPYALDRNPCGSSSGSGAAISANLACLGIGTETDGSIVCPASANGIVGIKPTLGRVSRTGIIPIAHSQDTAGPMARTVADAALLLAALVAEDPDDPGAGIAGPAAPFDPEAALQPGGLRGARIGVARARVTGYSEETDRLFEAALEVLRAEGAELVDPADIPHLGEYDDAEFEVLLYELKADLAAYFAWVGPGAPATSLADLIAFNEQNRDREMPYFGQEIFLRSQEKGPLTEPAYRDALARCRRLSRRDGLDALFAAHRLDAVVAPTGSPPWPTDLVNGDHFTGASSTPAAVAGYPAISVPIGFSFGLPVGMSLVGKAWDETGLVRLAFGYEQAAKPRRPPAFLPTARL